MSPLGKGILSGIGIAIGGLIIIIIIELIIVVNGATVSTAQTTMLILFILYVLGLVTVAVIGFKKYKTYLSDFGLGLSISIGGMTIFMILWYIYSSYKILYLNV